MSITATLNEVLVKLFREIMTIEEQSLKKGDFKDLTVNDMHVIEAIDVYEPKNMTTVARSLNVTTGTLTISINGLVKKGYVDRIRSEKDRRVVLVSLTEKGRNAHSWHEQFHAEMVQAVIAGLDEEEQVVLQRALTDLTGFFRQLQEERD